MTKLARALRLAVIRNALKSGQLTRDDAIKLLKGPLTPNDETTIVDDSQLIDISIEEFKAIFFSKDKE